MHEIHPKQLWVGHALDIRNPKPLFENGIQAVVDVAYEEPPALLPRQMIYCRFPLIDGGGNSAAILRQSIQTLLGLLQSQTPTIVACSAGLSRSPTIASFALASFLSKSPQEILEQIGAIKSLEINGLFWKEVEQATL